MHQPLQPIGPSGQPDGSRYMDSKNVLWILLAFSWTCWLLGIVLPLVELIPFPILRGQLSDYEPLDYLPHRSEKSTFQTLMLLHDSGYFFAFFILLICSVMVPALKLTTATLALLGEKWIPKYVISLLASFSSYQLLDIFLGILFVAFCNNEAFEANLRIGFFLYASFCVSSQVLMLTLEAQRKVALPEEVTEHSHEGPRTASTDTTLTYVHTPKLTSDWKYALLNGAVFLLLVLCGSGEPMLDTAITFNGIALSRTRLGFRQILEQVRNRCGWVMCWMLALSVVIAPFLVALLAFLVSLTKRGEHLLSVASKVAPWITADVFSLALVTFLFALQNEHLHTTIPDGSAFGITSEWFSGFYVGLALGAAGFAIKWKVVHEEHDEDDEDEGESVIEPAADVTQVVQPSGGAAAGSERPAFPGTGAEYAAVPTSQDAESQAPLPDQASAAPTPTPSRTSSVASAAAASASPSERNNSIATMPPVLEEQAQSTAAAPVQSGASSPPAEGEQALPAGEAERSISSGTAPVVEEAVASPTADQEQSGSGKSAVLHTELVGEVPLQTLASSSPAEGEQAPQTSEAEAPPQSVASSPLAEGEPTPSTDEAEASATAGAEPAKVLLASSPLAEMDQTPNTDGADTSVTAGAAPAQDDAASSSFFAAMGFTEAEADTASPPVEARADATISSGNVASASLVNLGSGEAGSTAGLPTAAPREPAESLTSPTEQAPASPSQSHDASPSLAGSSASPLQVQEKLQTGDAHISPEPEEPQRIHEPGGSPPPETSEEAAMASAQAVVASSVTEASTHAQEEVAGAAEVEAEGTPQEKSTDASVERKERQEDTELAPNEATKLVAEGVHGMQPPRAEDLEAGPPQVAEQQGADGHRRAGRRGAMGKVLRNPVFHVKAASWIIWGVCYFCVKGPEKLSYMKVNHALRGVLPLVNNGLHQILPKSMGNCEDEVSPPQPCVGNQTLFESPEISTGTEVVARWASGLNTVEFLGISMHIIPDSDSPIQVSIRGVLKNLKMSVRIAQCLMSVCKTIWDGDDGCCVPNRNFELIIATECDNDSHGRAQLGDFKVEWFDIDEIELSEHVLGLFSTDLADLTPTVRESVQERTTEIFNGTTVFLNLTFAQAVSRIWRYNTAEGVTCSDLMKTAR